MPLSLTRKGVLSIPDRIAALKDTNAYSLQLLQFAGMNMPYDRVPQANAITQISGHPQPTMEASRKVPCTPSW